jgi:hypothetical protein
LLTPPPLEALLKGLHDSEIRMQKTPQKKQMPTHCKTSIRAHK